MTNDLHAVARSFESERTDARFAALEQRFEARETLLRDEIETWKSHRAWSDKIVRAYLDEIERHRPEAQERHPNGQHDD
jgi:hypothetical protein